MGAEVEKLVTMLAQLGEQLLLQVEPRMIGAESDSHVRVGYPFERPRVTRDLVEEAAGAGQFVAGDVSRHAVFSKTAPRQEGGTPVHAGRGMAGRGLY